MNLKWGRVPSDPEPSDLGYDPTEWEVIRPEGGAPAYLFFPPEEMLEEEAFVVADEGAVCDLLTKR